MERKNVAYLIPFIDIISANVIGYRRGERVIDSCSPFHIPGIYPPIIYFLFFLVLLNVKKI